MLLLPLSPALVWCCLQQMASGGPYLHPGPVLNVLGLPLLLRGVPS